MIVMGWQAADNKPLAHTKDDEADEHMCHCVYET